MKLLRLLANLGYGSRREVEWIIRDKRVTDLAGNVLTTKSDIAHDQVLVDKEPLDPIAPLVILLNKPVGFTCSTDDQGELVYDLLPDRFAARNPVLSTVGRLDKDTSGLLLLTDDGQLLHRMIHPKHRVGKRYRATLDRDLKGNEAAIFASGELTLNNDNKPLLPAELKVISPREVELTIFEGRYHQVRRMFAAVGNHVLELQRVGFGSLEINDDLPEGEWRILTAEEIKALSKA